MRDLPVLTTQVTQSREFKYFDWVQITMPLKYGDGRPIVIRAAKGAFKMEPLETFSDFIITSYLNCVKRMPTESELDDAYALAQPYTDANDIDGYTLALQNLIRGFFHGGIYPDGDKGDYQFLTDVYYTFLNRIPATGERNSWFLISGGEGIPLDRSAVYGTLKDSDEFIDRIKDTLLPIEFIPMIESLSAIVIQEGRAMDNVEGVFVNKNDEFAKIFSERDRSLAPAYGIVGRAFYVGKEIFERNILMIGPVQITKNELGQIAFTVLSDMSNQGVKVIREITQRCSRQYKGEGCDTQDSSSTCSRIKDDTTNGCVSKDSALILSEGDNLDNRPSFLGVFKGAPHPIIPIIIDPNDPPWGSGGPINPACFLDGTMITMADGSKLPIELCEVGMLIQCPVWNGEYRKISIGRIFEVHRRVRENYANVLFEDDSETRVAPEHRYFSVNDRDYIPISQLWIRGRVAKREGNIWKNLHIKSFEIVNAATNVTNLTTEWETFLADDKDVHNVKIHPIEDPN